LPLFLVTISIVAGHDGRGGARTQSPSASFDAGGVLGLQAAGPGDDDAGATLPPESQEDPPASVAPAPTAGPGGHAPSRESTVAGVSVTATPTPRMPDRPLLIPDAPPGTRDKRLWPFSNASIWNMPIGSNAAYVPAGIAPAARLTVDVEYIVFPSPDDPLRPVFTNRTFGEGRCAQDTYAYDLNLPDGFIVPDARPGWTPNAPAAILASDGRTIRQMNPVSRCEQAGPLTAGWLAPDQDIYGDGILGGHGGSGLSSIGGSLRLGELTGPDPIRHALKVEVWGRRWLSPDDGGYRWPAITADSYFNDADSNAAYGGDVTALRMGALLAIPGDVDLATLGLQTPAAMKLAWTLQNYGAYVVDDTASDAHAFDVEAGVSQEFAGAYGYPIEAAGGPWFDDVMRIFAALAVVDNNARDSVGGGGTPRQPLAPPIGN